MIETKLQRFTARYGIIVSILFILALYLNQILQFLKFKPIAHTEEITIYRIMFFLLLGLLVLCIASCSQVNNKEETK